MPSSLLRTSESSLAEAREWLHHLFGIQPVYANAWKVSYAEHRGSHQIDQSRCGLPAAMETNSLQARPLLEGHVELCTGHLPGQMIGTTYP